MSSECLCYGLLLHMYKGVSGVWYKKWCSAPLCLYVLNWWYLYVHPPLCLLNSRFDRCIEGATWFILSQCLISAHFQNPYRQSVGHDTVELTVIFSFHLPAKFGNHSMYLLSIFLKFFCCELSMYNPFHRPLPPPFPPPPRVACVTFIYWFLYIFRASLVWCVKH